MLLALFHSRREGAVVDIVTRLQAEQLRGFNSIRGRSKSLLYFPQRHDRFWGGGSTQSPIKLVPGALFPGVRRLAREIEHSLPYNAEVENARAMLPLPLYALIACCRFYRCRFFQVCLGICGIHSMD